MLEKDKSLITFLNVLKVPSKHQVGTERLVMIPAGRPAASSTVADCAGRGGRHITHLQKKCSVQGTLSLGRKGVLWLLSLSYGAGALTGVSIQKLA